MALSQSQAFFVSDPFAVFLGELGRRNFIPENCIFRIMFPGVSSAGLSLQACQGPAPILMIGDRKNKRNQTGSC